MRVTILASGSGGNCIAVSTRSTTILVDVGIPAHKIERRLLEAGIRPDEVSAIFITHAHKDHIQGLALANKYRITVYAAENEWRDIQGADEELRETLAVGDFVRFNIYSSKLPEVWPFRTHHDAYDSLGYVIISDQKASICLDTGHIDQDMIEAMADSDIIVMEANHDPDMLAASDYPDAVKARIASDIGHLSNQQAADALAKLVRGRGERIYLTHLSRKNNLPALAKMTVEKTLRQQGYVNGLHYYLEVV